MPMHQMTGVGTERDQVGRLKLQVRGHMHRADVMDLQVLLLAAGSTTRVGVEVATPDGLPLPGTRGTKQVGGFASKPLEHALFMGGEGGFANSEKIQEGDIYMQGLPLRGPGGWLFVSPFPAGISVAANGTTTSNPPLVVCLWRAAPPAAP